MRRKRGQGAMLATIGPEWRRLLFGLAMKLDVDTARASIDPRRTLQRIIQRLNSISGLAGDR